MDVSAPATVVALKCALVSRGSQIELVPGGVRFVLEYLFHDAFTVLFADVLAVVDAADVGPAQGVLSRDPVIPFFRTGTQEVRANVVILFRSPQRIPPLRRGAASGLPFTAAATRRPEGRLPFAATGAGDPCRANRPDGPAAETARHPPDPGRSWHDGPAEPIRPRRQIPCRRQSGWRS